MVCPLSYRIGYLLTTNCCDFYVITHPYCYELTVKKNIFYSSA